MQDILDLNPDMTLQDVHRQARTEENPGMKQYLENCLARRGSE